MPSPGKPSQVPLANRPRSATRSKSRSPTAGTLKSKSKRTYTRRSPNTRLRALLQEVEDLFVKSCAAGAPSKAVPTLVPYAAPVASATPVASAAPVASAENNPFNMFNASQPSEAPATMVPMTLGDAFAKPATKPTTKLATKLATKVASKARTPKVAEAASAVPVSAVPVSKRGGPKPSLRANQEGSWNKFLKNWMAAHPGMKRPEAMKAAGENWKAFKAGKTPGSAAGAAGAAAGAAIGAAAGADLSRVGEEAEEEEEEEEEGEVEGEGEREENLGLL